MGIYEWQCVKVELATRPKNGAVLGTERQVSIGDPRKPGYSLEWWNGLGSGLIPPDTARPLKEVIKDLEADLMRKRRECWSHIRDHRQRLCSR